MPSRDRRRPWSTTRGSSSAATTSTTSSRSSPTTTSTSATLVHPTPVGGDAIFTWDYERTRPGLAKLYEKAKTSQWNGSTDLDW